MFVGMAPTATAQRDAVPALDSAQLIRDLFALAADSMEGRRIGTPGGERARTYLLKRLRDIGLPPMRDSFPSHFTSEGRGGAVNGVNLVALARGTKEPDRYIVLSAH
jgi:hypothetical protein